MGEWSFHYLDAYCGASPLPKALGSHRHPGEVRLHDQGTLCEQLPRQKIPRPQGFCDFHVVDVWWQERLPRQRIHRCRRCLPAVRLCVPEASFSEPPETWGCEPLAKMRRLIASLCTEGGQSRSPEYFLYK